MPTATTPLAVTLDRDMKARMQIIAKARHRSTHWIMREAIRQYVECEEKRESFRQAAIQAWNEYQNSGSHVSLDEADSWLSKLEDGQDVDPPECHV